MIDENDRFSLRAGVESIPTSVLLDADGTVLAAHIGLVTPTVTAFLDSVARYPGAGVFIAADHMVEPPGAALAPVSARDAEPIQSGDTVEGTIDDIQVQHAYRFVGHAGDRITATMTAGPGDLDPYLVLLRANGEPLEENDDIDPGVNTDARIDATLPADGTYLLVATRFLEAEGVSEGPFTLTVRRTAPDGTPVTATQTSTPDARAIGTLASTPDDLLNPDAPAPSANPQGNGGMLHYGDTVRGTISDRQHQQRWRFEGQAGDVIDIVMQRTVDEDGGLDGFLILEGPDGDTLLEVDDANNSVMPAISGYALPADGVYTIVATRFSFASGFSAGDYTLALTLAEDGSGIRAGAGPTWTLPEDMRWLSYNETAQGQIDADNLADWYAFRGHAGDVITIHMAAQIESQAATASGALDSLLILTDIEGHELLRDDDSGGQHDAEISIELPDSGTYLVRATRYGFANGPSSGRYKLVIASDSPATDTASTAIPALAYGDSVSGTLTLEQPVARYRFTGRAGDAITLHVVGEDNLTPLIMLRGPDGDTLADDRHTLTASGSALLRVPLPAAGDYTLEIVPQDLSSSGAYRLLLLGHTAPPVDAGAFVPAPDLDLELVLIWSSAADLDLTFGTATGTPTDAATDAALAMLEPMPANDFCQDTHPTPVERVIWAAGQSVPGQYSAAITYRHNCAGQLEPVQFILAIARQGEVIGITGGTLAQESDRYTTPVTIWE